MVLDVVEGEKKIEVQVIFEVLGKPPEHLKDSLNKLLEEIDKEDGIKILGKKIHDPKPIENSELFTTFADVGFEIDNLEWIVVLMFKYMPAHIEIITPENLTLSNNTWNEFLNELARRLHQYDEVARIMTNEKMILENKLKEVLEKKEEIPEQSSDNHRPSVVDAKKEEKKD